MFAIPEDKVEQLNKWMKEQDEKVAKLQNSNEAYYGAIGGDCTYCFTPTGLGIVIVVKNNVTKEEINLTDYENW